MSDCILIHYGEISLKGRNQPQFRKKLLKNIQISLKSVGIEWPIRHYRGYLSLSVVKDERDKVAEAIKKLRQVFGITWFANAKRFEYEGFEQESVEKILDTIQNELCELARDKSHPEKSFCVQVKRSDKRFPVNSVELGRRFGTSIKDNTSWDKVNLKNPDQIFYVEIQNKEVFIHKEKYRGMGGLPVNTAQKVLVMLSGGIDSPVAAYLTARRGCQIDLLHFTASHVTAEEIKNNKIGLLSKKLSEYTLKSTLYVLPSTYFDLAIAGKEISYELILFRRFMANAAQKLAEKIKAHALVTGDNLSQVASQTLTNIVSTTRAIELPVLQPLITYDKEEIVQLAESIGSFDLSIQPYKDCCSIFQRNPRTVSDHNEMTRIEKHIFTDYDKMISQTLDDMFRIAYRYGYEKGIRK